MIDYTRCIALIWILVFILPDNVTAQRNIFQYRSYNGLYNDLRNFHEGQAGIPFERMVGDYHYPDGPHAMADNSNPRYISNLLCNQEEHLPDNQGLSSLVFTFLQFIDHDITATREGHLEYVPIKVPAGDPYFDPLYSGQVQIPFTRSAYVQLDDKFSREQINDITAWLDGSAIYGSDEVRAKWLRSGKCGKLKVSPSAHGDLLPCNTISGDCNDEIDPSAPSMAMNQNRDGSYRKVFVAGDVRANEQPGLTALHTIFPREHNRICDELIADGECNDEKNYQYARKIVGGLMQSILYNELLPILGVQTGNDRYDRGASPNITNIFATAAFRLGHTMVSDEIPLINTDCGKSSDALSLAEAFFNPTIIQEKGLEGIVRGLHSQTQEKIDAKLVHGIRNFLFGPPGAGGLDLAALNIQRSRDHGLPYYNATRDNLELKKIKSFREISSDPQIRKSLEQAYGSVDKIDSWIGLLCEDPIPGTSFGPTLLRLLSDQFRAIKQADRFYYTRDYVLPRKVREEITKTRLSDIIQRNTSIERISKAFFKHSCEISPDLVYCDLMAKSSSYEWISEVNINDYQKKSGNDNGYADYTQQPIPAYAGQKINLYLRGGFKGIGYKEYWNVWVDVNRDGEFSEDELMYSKRDYKDSYGSFYLPESTATGTTRVRIVMSYYKSKEACGSIKYGEVEDYSLDVRETSLVASVRSKNVQEVSLETDAISELFPNPASNKTSFYIDLTDQRAVEWSVVNASGQVVLHEVSDRKKGRHLMQFQTESLPPGAYQVRIQSGETVHWKKLIRIR